MSNVVERSNLARLPSLMTLRRMVLGHRKDKSLWSRFRRKCEVRS